MYHIPVGYRVDFIPISLHIQTDFQQLIKKDLIPSKAIERGCLPVRLGNWTGLPVGYRKEKVTGRLYLGRFTNLIPV